MKLFIYIYAFLLASLPFVSHAKSQANDVHSDDIFKIIFVNAPNHQILINGIPKEVEDTFRANANISWINPGDYIRTENLRNRQDYKITHQSYKRMGANSLSNYIHKRYTGTKGDKDYSPYNTEGLYLSNFPWELLNGEVEIPVNLPIDDNNFYVLRSIPNDAVIIADIDSENGKIYITQEQLSDNGIHPDNIRNYSFCVQYIHDDVANTLTNDLTIEYIETYQY